MDQRAGLWPVEEGGGSSSSGSAAMSVEENAPMNKLVAPSAPTADDREEHTASGHAVFRTWCRECCIGRGRMHQHRAGGRETTIPAIAIGYRYLNERDDLLQEAAGAPIWVSKCNRDRCICAAIVLAQNMRLLNSRTTWLWLHRGSRQFGQRAGDFGPEGVSSNSVEIERCECQDGRECTVRFAKQRTGQERCERCKSRRENELGLSRQTLWTRVSRRTPSPKLRIYCFGINKNP